MGMRKRFSKKFIMVTLTGLIAVMLPLTAVAGTINGTITDKTDGEVLMGATVNVKSAISGFEPRGTAADKDGFFEFTDMLPGKYIVIVSSIGFTPQTFSEIEVTESGNQSMKVSLTPTYIDLDAISVTASRRPEKLVEAPASVAVVDAESVEARTTLTPTEHLKGLAAVDVASTGLNQSNVVVRGFNNIFSGALLVLTDNRIARVPSLRFNAYNFISTINEDIERIEIVSGPGSALYGPNSASGVMHIITKSPFASQGTTFSLGGGERDLVIGSFRHAGTYNDRIGYKITGQYYQGHDWEHTEQAEEDNDLIQKYLPTADGPEFVGDSIPAERDFDINKLAGDGRLDFLIGDNSSLIVNSGFSRSSSIELTGLGAGQAIDWTYWFAQTRYRYKDLFIQGFVNASDAGDTYLLQTGQLIVDKSKLWAGQIQHSYSTSDNLSFTYGFDALFTRPNTEATINGGNEENDDIDEFGIYLQSDAQLNDKLKLVTAVRLDDNNRLKDMVISPRAGLVYQPVENHNLRATYNRAYSTPDNNNLYLDIMQTNDMGDLGTNFETALGFRPEVDIRVQGVPESGFHWRINDNGPQFRSSFAPVAGLTTSDYIDFNDPMFTNVMWGIGRSATIAGFKGKLLAAGLSEPQIEALASALSTVTSATVSGVNNMLRTVNPDNGLLEPSTLDDIADIDRLKPTITQTFELGYNGMLGNRLKFNVDVYRTQKNDFIGPLTVETPNVFLDPATLSAFLGNEFDTALFYNPAEAAALGTVIADSNSNGLTDELTALFAENAAGIPFGTVTPQEAVDPTAVLVTYRNFGDISFYGTDLAFAYHLNQNWNFGGSYSYISKNFFEKSGDQVHDIHLNSPRHKFGVQLHYTNPGIGFNAQTRFRFIDAFEMDSPFYGSQINAYKVVDVNMGLNFFYNTHLALTIQNLFDNKHVEFIGGPEIGRLAIMRLTQTF